MWSDLTFPLLQPVWLIWSGCQPFKFRAILISVLLAFACRMLIKFCLSSLLFGSNSFSACFLHSTHLEIIFSWLLNAYIKCLQIRLWGAKTSAFLYGIHMHINILRRGAVLCTGTLYKTQNTQFLYPTPSELFLSSQRNLNRKKRNHWKPQDTKNHPQSDRPFPYSTRATSLPCDFDRLLTFSICLFFGWDEIFR